ncbi:MAG: HAD family phosphatase [Prevotella sp.]|nr:HAD family phosphatase [Prevotella sp.]
MVCPRDIKNIIFDMGGVLVPLAPERCIASFCRLGAVRTADYVRECRTEDMFLDIETGAMTTAAFCASVRRLDNIDAADNDITAAWNDLLLPSGSIRRGALECLRERGFRLFILSNTCEIHWLRASSELIPAEGKHIADYFERAFLSYELHCRKPAPEIYSAVLELAGIRADETLFIDDNPLNLSAAATLGLRTFHERTEHHWFDLSGEGL